MGKEFIVLFFSLTLHNVLHVSNWSYYLLYVNELIHDQNCQANFSHSQCEFQDLYLGNMIDRAKQSERLYFFKDGSNLKG